jgi:uncharacterized protein YndB with AHSA1/START domain
MGFEISTTISSSNERVWAVLTDVERWPEWTPSMTKVTRLDEGPFAKGSQASVKQPRLPAMVWTVTEVTPGRSFVWEAKRPGVTLVAGHHLTSEDDNGSVKVVLSVEQRGALGRVLEPLTSRSAKRYVTLEAEGLKLRSESG